MAKILLKNALIYNQVGKQHGKRRDILIVDGIISEIKSSIASKADHTIKSKNLCVSGGWLDIGCFNGEPGYEYREDLDSLRAVAVQGGYTHLAPFPTGLPPMDNKSQVQYLLHQNINQAVHMIPIAAMSKGRKGVDIGELLDLKQAGAVAFSDGKSGTNINLLERSLQYLKSQNTTVIHVVNSKDELDLGQVNEGASSVYLGLQGLPEYKEKIDIDKVLEAIRYTGGKALIHNISLSSSVKSIEKARKDISVDISIPYLNLIYNDTDVINFDVNLKILPPLRSQIELNKLIKAIEKGQINVITSNHNPKSKEEKDEPFGQSSFGATGLNTLFPALVTHTPLSLDRIVQCLSFGPYQALLGDPPQIKVGEKANLTFFDPDEEFVFNPSLDHSKSINNPFYESKLKGKVLGIINFNNFEQNL